MADCPQWVALLRQEGSHHPLKHPSRVVDVMEELFAPSPWTAGVPWLVGVVVNCKGKPPAKGCGRELEFHPGGRVVFFFICFDAIGTVG